MTEALHRVSVEEQAKAYKPVEVDLWADGDGALFHTIELTKPVLDSLKELRARAFEAADEAAQLGTDEDDTADDDIAALERVASMFGELFDAITVPANGSRKTAKVIIEKKFASGGVSINTLKRTFQAVLEGGTDPT